MLIIQISGIYPEVSQRTIVLLTHVTSLGTKGDTYVNLCCGGFSSCLSTPLPCGLFFVFHDYLDICNHIC